MKKIKLLLKDEHGVTLVELLIVIALIGILSTAVAGLYRLSINTWHSSNNQAVFALNALNVFKSLTKDVHESEQIQTVSNTQVSLLHNDKEVRYLVQANGQDIQLKRELRFLGSPDWEQNPKYPIAHFKVTDQINFEKISASLMDANFVTDNYQLQTSFSIRNMF